MKESLFTETQKNLITEAQKNLNEMVETYHDELKFFKDLKPGSKTSEEIISKAEKHRLRRNLYKALSIAGAAALVVFAVYAWFRLESRVGA